VVSLESVFALVTVGKGRNITNCQGPWHKCLMLGEHHPVMPTNRLEVMAIYYQDYAIISAETEERPQKTREDGKWPSTLEDSGRKEVLNFSIFTAFPTYRPCLSGLKAGLWND
jgi:hypothetical protein